MKIIKSSDCFYGKLLSNILMYKYMEQKQQNYVTTFFFWEIQNFQKKLLKKYKFLLCWAKTESNHVGVILSKSSRYLLSVQQTEIIIISIVEVFLQKFLILLSPCNWLGAPHPFDFVHGLNKPKHYP